MICHTAADPEAYPELPSEVVYNFPSTYSSHFSHVDIFPGGQLHGTLPPGTSRLVPSAQVFDVLLRDHGLQGGQHQDWAAHVSQEDPWL